MKLLDVIWAILRGIFWGIVDGYPFDDSKGAEQKERPWWEEQPPPRAEQPAGDPAPKDNPAPKDRATAPGWWAAPAPPASPPTVKVETDAGTFVAATSFSGHHLMGIRRVERPRQDGESRRRRRARSTEATSTNSTAIDSAQLELRAQEPEVPHVTRVDVELRPREPDVPKAAPTTSLAPASPTTPTTAAPAPRRVDAGRDAAVPIEPGEEPRVARARRVRSRLGPPDARGAPQLVTTLATRLALTACSPALAVAKKRA